MSDLRVLRTWYDQAHLYAEMEITDDEMARAIAGDPGQFSRALAASSAPLAFAPAPDVRDGGESSLAERCRRVVDDREERVRDLLGLARPDGDRVLLDLLQSHGIAAATHPHVPRGEAWLAPTGRPRVAARLPEPASFAEWHKMMEEMVERERRAVLPIRITGVLGPDA